MASVNKVIIIGNLGADPEVRQANGQPVASMRIATSESYTDRDGARQERTEWHNVTAWGKLAELCGQYLAKGRSVYVEGRLQSREYEKDGVTRKVWDIVASTVTFLGQGHGQQSQPASQPQQRPGSGSSGGSGGWGGGHGGGSQPNRPAWGARTPDDDVPF